MTQERADAFQRTMAQAVPLSAIAIESHIAKIKELVRCFHPLRLMHCAFFDLAGKLANKPSEIDHGREEGNAVRTVEYIQSILCSVSSTSYPADEDFDMAKWRQLRDEIATLYDKLRTFLFQNSSARKLADSNYDENFEDLYIQAQAMWLDVRGERHQFHDVPHLRDFLIPHDDVFRELFGIPVEEFLGGLKNLEFSLTQGLGKTIEEMKEFQQKATDAFDKKMQTAESQETVRTVMQKVIAENEWRGWLDSIMSRFSGFDLFDVQKATAWPVSLLNELSWKLGEETEFFMPGQFSGWPFRMLPVHRRPFLQFEGRYYCFNLWSIMDNAYRIMQRTLIRLKPSYKEVWNRRQQAASEYVPFRLLQKVLPSAIVYRPVFYLAKNHVTGRDEWCEADGLVIFDDHLIVAEVKAGAFTAAPPTIDFDSYIKSVARLILAPASQASRFLKRFEEVQEISVYDKQHTLLTRLQRSQFRHVTACCVTLDRLSELGARTQHLKPLGVDVINVPIWALSVDDLRVYSDIFDSEVTFGHFLEQRQLASKVSFLTLFDELDHLGMYLEHNMYVRHAEELSRNITMHWIGYRKDIDLYFSKLSFFPGEAVKPSQSIPARLSEVLGMLDAQKKADRCKTAAHLLNLDEAARNDIANGIDYALRRQREINRSAPFSLAGRGEAKLTVFCRQPGIDCPNISQMSDYALSLVLRGAEAERLLLILAFNDANRLQNVSFQFLCPGHITDDRRAELERLATIYAGTRLETRIKNQGKIGRNEPCPCGSGRKFKHCCGK